MQVLSLSARCGLLYPLSPHGSFFFDRFQLGGPLSVRGVRWNGLGPTDWRMSARDSLLCVANVSPAADVLGGNVFWAAGASLLADVPWRAHWPLKGHLFANAGRLDALDPTRMTLGVPSVTAGIGLVIHHGPKLVMLAA